MFLALMLSALTADPGSATLPPTRAVATVRISLNNDGYYDLGDRVTVRVSSSEDGYLIVFRATTRGRVRVLFPLDPGLDDFVRGGKTYDVIGRGGKESFRVDDEEGSGVVYAAVSDYPLQFNQFMRGDHWDYRAFEDYQVSDDAETVFGDLMEKMASGGRYQYDLVSYHVAGNNYSSDDDYHSNDYDHYGHYHYDGYAGFYAPCFGCSPYYGSGFSFSIASGLRTIRSIRTTTPVLPRLLRVLPILLRLLPPLLLPAVLRQQSVLLSRHLRLHARRTELRRSSALHVQARDP